MEPSSLAGWIRLGREVGNMTEKRTKPLQNRALEYHRLGLCVIPIPYGTKAARIRWGKYQLPAEERAHLQMDIEAVLADLPPDLRRAAELLQVHPIVQVAREMGIPHATFYENHLVRLREAFAAKGLGDYLT